MARGSRYFSVGGKMGLKRKLSARVELILPFDDAVKGGYREYAEDYDRSKLVLEGEPTVFAIEPLTSLQKDVIDRMMSGFGKRRAKRMAIQCGLRDVVGYVIEKADGTTEILSAPRTVAAEIGGSIIDDKWYDGTFDPSDEELDAISEAILRISRLDPL